MDTYNNNAKKGFNSKTITEGFILPCFDMKETCIMHICGQSESGNTTYAYNLAKLYIVMFPQAQIFMFSIKNK